MNKFNDITTFVKSFLPSAPGVAEGRDTTIAQIVDNEVLVEISVEFSVFEEAMDRLDNSGEVAYQQ